MRDSLQGTAVDSHGDNVSIQSIMTAITNVHRGNARAVFGEAIRASRRLDESGVEELTLSVISSMGH